MIVTPAKAGGGAVAAPVPVSAEPSAVMVFRLCGNDEFRA